MFCPTASDSLNPHRSSQGLLHPTTAYGYLASVTTMARLSVSPLPASDFEGRASSKVRGRVPLPLRTSPSSSAILGGRTLNFLRDESSLPFLSLKFTDCRPVALAASVNEDLRPNMLDFFLAIFFSFLNFALSVAIFTKVRNSRMSTTPSPFSSTTLSILATHCSESFIPISSNATFNSSASMVPESSVSIVLKMRSICSSVMPASNPPPAGFNELAIVSNTFSHFHAPVIA
mmetsp:Transcript_22489/g.38350  ORF Transcript_22489/g.38350 Transcript_22489/m.38350 type:complete len:232 (-) Transcript_22489:660-1355(-)